MCLREIAEGAEKDSEVATDIRSFMKRDEVILPYEVISLLVTTAAYEILSIYKSANFSFGFLPLSFSFKLLENPENKGAMQIIPHGSDSKLLAESGKLFTSSTDVE